MIFFNIDLFVLHIGHEVPRVVEGIVMSDQAKNLGTVKFFSVPKGFGFIQLDAGGEDVFVHISAIQRSGMQTVSEGQKLSFDVVRDNRSGRTSAENLQAA